MAQPKLFPIFSKDFRPNNNKSDDDIQSTLDKLHPAKRRKNLLVKTEPGLTQMFLDAGQKTIGPVHCEECGLFYSPGDVEDEKEHKKEHTRLDNLLCLRLWKNANIIGDYPAESCSIVMVDCQTESKRVLNSLQGLLTWLDYESKPTDKIFLYLFRTRRKGIHRVLGCAIVEDITIGKILLGITKLWTDEAFRRKGIASRMCDSIRFNYSIGLIISKDQLGILEPSEDGMAFMKSYGGQCY